MKDGRGLWGSKDREAPMYADEQPVEAGSSHSYEAPAVRQPQHASVAGFLCTYYIPCTVFWAEDEGPTGCSPSNNK